VGNSSTSSSRRRFAVKLVLFLVLLVVLDAGIGGLLRVFYFKQTSGLNFRSTYAINECNEDYIILGSSRAQANYVPSIFQDTLDASCYNAGRDGQCILYSYAVQQAILARYKPEVLVLDVILSDFFVHGPHYDKLSALLPYYDSHEEIRPIVHMRSRFERIKMFSRIYPFNSLVLQILKYNKVEGREQNGYVPQHGELKLPLSAREKRVPSWTNGELDSNMVQTLEAMVESCKNMGVRLIVVISPVYEGQVLGKSALSKVKEVLGESSVQLWDYSDYPGIVNNSKLFRDKGHLNNIGAKLYTETITKRIKTELGYSQGQMPAE
jgi:hypothetical protein